ncbi:hypothetical protein [Actinomadura sp. 9N215]|uniref:hypothetical protein n=1 Tax=Actinomadura sp. 9N215 TaxID=3375150 RepID=UPI003793E565
MSAMLGVHDQAGRLRRAIEIRRCVEEARTEDGYPKSADAREALDTARNLADWTVAELTEELLDTLDRIKES